MSARVLGLVIAVVLVASPVAQTPTSPDALLKAAQQREQVDGDWRAALAEYKSLVTRFPDAVASAHALMRIGAIFERNGDREPALEAYQQALKHRHASVVTAEARARVNALTSKEAVLERRQLKIPDAVVEYGQLSPDGQWVSFNDSAIKTGSGNLGIWNLSSGQTQLLTGEPCCDYKNGFSEASVWSPNGDALAYTWRNSRTDLRVVERASRRVRVLLDADAVDRLVPLEGTRGAWIQPFAWSPNGAFLLAAAGVFEGPGVAARSRWIRVSLHGGATTELRALGPRNVPTHASYSPDGKHIAYDFAPGDDTGGRDVYVMSADGSQQVTIVEDAVSDDRLIGWTSDGRHLLYTGNRLGPRDVWAIPVAGGRSTAPPFVVTRDVGDLTNRGFAPNGRFLAEIALNHSDIFVTKLDPQSGRFTSTPAPLARLQADIGRGQATWSPSGDRIAYFQSGGQVLVVQNISTNSIRSYRLPARNSERPVWHPNGQSIAFNAVGDAEAQAVFLLDLGTEKVTRVGRGPQSAFSRDGRYIYFVGAPQTLRRKDLVDGTEEDVLRIGGVGVALKMSPDGRHFAIFRGQTREIVLVRVDGSGEPKVLTPGIERTSNQITWSPDGKYILFVVWNEVWRISVDDGAPEKLGAITERSGVIKHLSITADGRLAMSMAGYDSELWLWNNLPALVNRK